LLDGYDCIVTPLSIAALYRHHLKASVYPVYHGGCTLHVQI